jgi:hypothetical protein
VYTKENGEAIRVDSSTPGGTYRITEGRTLRLNPKLGYPRYFEVSDRPTRCLFFSIHSSSRVVVLADAESGRSLSVADARTELLTRFHSGITYLAPLEKASAAFEVPADWYLRGSVTFGQTLKSPVRLTWVAFGTQNVTPGWKSPAFKREGNRVTYVPSLGTPAHDESPPSDALLESSLRIVGELVVDPSSGRVVRPEGH